METSKKNDWERRRSKPKKAKWAKRLISRRTFRILVTVGRALAFVLWLHNQVTGWLRE